MRVFRVSLARLKESRFESFRRSRRMRLLIPFATSSKKRNDDDDDEPDGWIIVLPTCLSRIRCKPRMVKLLEVES